MPTTPAVLALVSLLTDLMVPILLAIPRAARPTALN
jgi:hypothetical protein